MSKKEFDEDDFPRVKSDYLRFFLFAIKEFRSMYIATVQSRPAMAVLGIAVGSSGMPLVTSSLMRAFGI